MDHSTYRDGIENGLRAALVVVERRGGGPAVPDLESLIARTERNQPRRPVDGEAEWQSWMAELEMQMWERDALATKS